MTVPFDKPSDNDNHEYEFTSAQQLERLVGNIFGRVETFVSQHPDRGCLYFTPRS